MTQQERQQFDALKREVDRLEKQMDFQSAILEAQAALLEGVQALKVELGELREQVSAYLAEPAPGTDPLAVAGPSGEHPHQGW